jgi:hypothetical protein
LQAKFYGSIDLRKGEIIKILKVFPDDRNLIMATVIENLTTEQIFRSRYEGVIAANPSVLLANPITGKVIHSNNNGYDTSFELVLGTYQDYVFVKAGEKQKGQDALIDILKNQLHSYVKICDPYINQETIRLISNAPSDIHVLILTDTIANISEVKKEIFLISNKISVRKGLGLHDRFILTKGEGWSVGHSLKDFGSKNSQLIKMASSIESEDAFDENWNTYTSIIVK